jgi:hypothetical protein
MKVNKEHEEIRELVKAKLGAHHDAFHPIWGQLFKAGFQESRFAQQVYINIHL